jgi:hypothetical protein
MKNIFRVFMLLVLFAGCKKQTQDSPAPQGDTTVPNISYPIASFASAYKFIPFGAPLQAGGTNTGYEVYLSDGQQAILSASSGIVSSINTDNKGNSTIEVKFKTNSIYTFRYAGVRSLLVHLGDSITPGTLLGKISTTGVIDFAMVKNGHIMLCPQLYASSSFNNSIQVAITRHNALNPNSQVTEACQADMVTE